MNIDEELHKQDEKASIEIGVAFVIALALVVIIGVLFL